MDNYQEYINRPLQNPRTGWTRVNNGSLYREQRIKKLFGISASAVDHRLRKAILFKYVQKAGDNICFVCKKDIKLIHELSIEHKKPWEGEENAVALYWDLDNIVFSHRRCNKAHRYKGWSWQRKIEGDKAWCSKCKIFKEKIEFYKLTARWNGVTSYCINCTKINRQERKRRPIGFSNGDIKHTRVKMICITCNQPWYEISSRANRSRFHFCSKKCWNPILWLLKNNAKEQPKGIFENI